MMRLWRTYGTLLGVVGILGLSSAIACQPPGATSMGRIQGKVTIGPSCPVMQVGVNCPDRPYQTLLEFVDAGGSVVKQVESDRNGAFSVELPPGTYRIRAAGASTALPFLKEKAPISVTPNGTTGVNVRFDSGIR